VPTSIRQSGGSSGIYLVRLLRQARHRGRHQAEGEIEAGRIRRGVVSRTGRREVGLHQISEILPVKGVKLVRSASGRNPELHDLTRPAAGVQAQQKDGAEAIAEAAGRAARRGGAEGARHGAPAVVNEIALRAD
jgi:hypothetical protein